MKTALLIMLVFSNPQPAMTFNQGDLAVVCRFPDLTGATLCVPFDLKSAIRCWYSWDKGLLECEPGV